MVKLATTSVSTRCNKRSGCQAKEEDLASQHLAHTRAQTAIPYHTIPIYLIITQLRAFSGICETSYKGLGQWCPARQLSILGIAASQRPRRFAF